MLFSDESHVCSSKAQQIGQYQEGGALSSKVLPIKWDSKAPTK